MNLRQLSYIEGNIRRFAGEVFPPFLLLDTAYFSYAHFSSGDIKSGSINAAAAAISGLFTLVYSSGIIGTIIKRMKTRNIYSPLEHVHSIVIEDQEGLEKLLDRTSEFEPREWGTLLQVTELNGEAFIDKILDYEDPRSTHVLQTINNLLGKRFFKFDGRQANKLLSVQGDVHYHPPDFSPVWGASNYVINSGDRHRTPNNWLNLLTFNLPDGPKVIGYNARFTYIPENDSNQRLVRANPMQIMKYLGALDAPKPELRDN